MSAVIMMVYFDRTFIVYMPWTWNDTNFYFDKCDLNGNDVIKLVSYIHKITTVNGY